MPKDGFSIMTVMIGSVVVAALAVVYMQKARNKAQIAAVTDIIAYKDYVFRYYSEVAANRMAWPCTLKANPSLRAYVQGGGGPAGPHNLWLYDASGTGCVLAGTGVEVITGSGAGTAQGLGVKLYSPLPIQPANIEIYDPNDTDHHLRIYATWEGLGRNAVRIRLATSYNYEHSDAITSFKVKEKEKLIYMNRTPSRNCSDALSVGLGYYGDRGTGTDAPQRYFGDTAVTSVDAKTRLVTCYEEGPLVIPPCFDLLEKNGLRIGFSNNCTNLSTNKYSTWAGMCPEGEGSAKVLALAGFDQSTGKTICEHDYGLILGDRVLTASAYQGKGASDTSAFVGLGSAHSPIYSPTDRFGTRGGRQSRGIKGWTINGPTDAGANVGMPGLAGQPGHPGVLPALRGPPGANVVCPAVTRDYCYP